MASRVGRVMVNVDIEDVLDDIDDDTLRDIYAKRFGSHFSTQPDLLSEIERHLYAGRVNDALALIVAEQVARRTTDVGKLSEYRRLIGVA